MVDYTTRYVCSRLKPEITKHPRAVAGGIAIEKRQCEISSRHLEPGIPVRSTTKSVAEMTRSLLALGVLSCQSVQIQTPLHSFMHLCAYSVSTIMVLPFKPLNSPYR